MLAISDRRKFDERTRKCCPHLSHRQPPFPKTPVHSVAGLHNVSFHQFPFPQIPVHSVAGLLSDRGPGTLKMALNTISNGNNVAGLHNKKRPGTKKRGTRAKDRRPGTKNRGPGAKGRGTGTHCLSKGGRRGFTLKGSRSPARVSLTNKGGGASFEPSDAAFAHESLILGAGVLLPCIFEPSDAAFAHESLILGAVVLLLCIFEPSDAAFGCFLKVNIPLFKVSDPAILRKIRIDPAANGLHVQ